MIIIKHASIFLVILASTMIGILYSKRYTGRVKELEEIKKALNIFKTKIKFTYEPIPDLFNEISKEVKPNIGRIFLKSSKYMKQYSTGDAWKKSIEEERTNTSLKEEDIEVIKGLSKMLGNVDLEGEINNIEGVCSLLDQKIYEAENEKLKTEKLCKVLGASVGLTIAIILI